MKKNILILCILFYVISGCSENSIFENDNTSLTNWTLLSKEGYGYTNLAYSWS